MCESIEPFILVRIVELSVFLMSIPRPKGCCGLTRGFLQWSGNSVIFLEMKLFGSCDSGELRSPYRLCVSSRLLRIIQ